MPERSIHDNRLISYTVDSKLRRIVLHTQFDDAEPVEYTNVVFESVIAYHLEHDNFSSIVFAIEEVAVGELVLRCSGLFESGGEYAWPGAWNTSVEASIAHLESCDAKAFELQASFGVSGWVIAASCLIEPAAARNL